MENESSTTFDRMNRRSLLGRGTALTVGALAGFRLQPPSAWGQAEARIREAGSRPEIKEAHAEESPNWRPPVVQTTLGKVAGFMDDKIYAFRGIPYAEADRFEMPKPVKPWDGIKNAQTWGYACPHPAFADWPSRHEFEMPHREWLVNERCQVLNIWIPGLGSQVKKPVMVWFHGGGFTSGTSMDSFAYDGKNLSEFGDVVVVSMNHRLNILGTLDLSAYGPEYANSRNTGMADLVAALEWVHENIESFGGDPANVTLFGQSGGGSKVVRLMHMPAAKGLFHKVVAQSGGNLAYRDTDPAASIKTQQMIAAATLKNLSLDGSQIDKLKKLRYDDLIAAGNAALRSVGEEIRYKGPSWEKNLSWDSIADDSYVMRELCDWADSIPLMAGTTFSEFGAPLADLAGTGKNFWSGQQIDEHLLAAFGESKGDIVVEFKRDFPSKKVQDVLYYSTARSAVKSLLARKLEKSKAPVWNYLFSYEYPVNGGIMAFHTSEIVFVFHNVGQPESRRATGGTPAAFALQNKVAKAWINFAKTGNPSLQWNVYTLQDPKAVVFDTVSEVYPLRDDKLIALLSSRAEKF